MDEPAPVATKPKRTIPIVPWSPVIALFLVAGVYFVAPLIAGIAVAIPPLLMGWNAERLEAWLTDSVYAQFFYVLLAEILTVGALVLFLKRYKKGLSFIGLKRPRFKDIGTAVLAYPVYFIALIVIVAVASQLIPALDINQEQELGFDGITGTLPLIVTFISLVVLPPLVEEIMVRGFLFTSLRKHLSFIGAALVTSIGFGAAHLSASSSGPLYIAAIDTFVLSMVLCYVREKTGSLWAGIAVHALKNGIAFLSLYILV